jgi:hypothetical protein
VSAAENGSVELQNDGYTARFTPAAKGLASFKYTVKGNDGTEYTGRVEVLVEKSAEADSTTTRLADKYHLRAEAVTVGVFDMNGHYVGVTTQGLPQGRYMVRQKVNGRIVNKLVRKD